MAGSRLMDCDWVWPPSDSSPATFDSQWLDIGGLLAIRSSILALPCPFTSLLFFSFFSLAHCNNSCKCNWCSNEHKFLKIIPLPFCEPMGNLVSGGSPSDTGPNVSTTTQHILGTPVTSPDDEQHKGLFVLYTASKASSTEKLNAFVFNRLQPSGSSALPIVQNAIQVRNNN